MSVIVKDMEMPKHCYDCPLQDGETGRCNILGITVYATPKECPLVEVVRCKDCIYSQDVRACNLPYGIDGYCPLGKGFDDEGTY